MSDNSDLRRLTNLRGVSRKDDPDLSDLLDGCQKGFRAEEIAVISHLVNYVSSYKSKEKEQYLEKKIRVFGNYEGEPTYVNRSGKLIEQRAEAGASSVSTGPIVKTVYSARLCDHSWTEDMEERGVDETIYVGLRVLIPFGKYPFGKGSGPEDEGALGDVFQLHKFRMFRRVSAPKQEDKGKTEVQNKGKDKETGGPSDSGVTLTTGPKVPVRSSSLWATLESVPAEVLDANRKLMAYLSKFDSVKELPAKATPKASRKSSGPKTGAELSSTKAKKTTADPQTPEKSSGSKPKKLTKNRPEEPTSPQSAWSSDSPDSTRFSCF